MSSKSSKIRINEGIEQKLREVKSLTYKLETDNIAYWKMVNDNNEPESKAVMETIKADSENLIRKGIEIKNIFDAVRDEEERQKRIEERKEKTRQISLTIAIDEPINEGEAREVQNWFWSNTNYNVKQVFPNLKGKVEVISEIKKDKEKGE